MFAPDLDLEDTGERKSVRLPPPLDPLEILAASADLLERLDILLSSAEPMCVDERRRHARLSAPREAALGQVAALCAELAIDHLGGETVASMLLAFDEVQATRRALASVELVRARLDARRVRTEARCVQLASLFYGLLRVVARRDESLAARLAPIAAYFQGRRRQRRLRPACLACPPNG